MKLKLKPNFGAIKPLAMQHGEKALFGLAVLGLLMFIWSAAKTEVLGPEKQQDKLKESADKSDLWVENSQWDPKAKGVEVVDYVKRASDLLVNQDYRLATFFDKPLWESKGKRPEPKVLPVEEMLASAGLGIFAMKPPEDPNDPAPAAPRPRRAAAGAAPAGPVPPPPGGARGAPPCAAMARALAQAAFDSAEDAKLKGLSWVVVTGLVPIAKQEAEFEEAFHNVKFNDPELDFPEFYGLRVERAAVADGSVALDWQPLNRAEMKKLMTDFQAMVPELVDEEFVDPEETMPLGPMIGTEWTFKQVGHTNPKIKEVEKRGSRSVHKEDPVVKPAEEDEDEGGFNPDARRAKADFVPPPIVGQPNRQGKGGTQRRKQGDFVLFRIVDYTVEPGKQYRYRVQRRLKNPNRGVAEKWLKDPATRAKKTIDSPWSEPTPVVTVPRDIELFAGGVPKPAREPTVKVLIKKLDRERGLQLPKVAEFARGALLNIAKPKLEIDGVEITDAVLDSNALLVDIRGGGRLSIKDKTLTEPAELMILQADGSLVVHDELDDEEAYLENQATPTVDRKKGKGDSDVVVPGDAYETLKKHRDGTPVVPKKKKGKKGARTPPAPPPTKTAK